jgi:hypothetical protein
MILNLLIIPCRSLSRSLHSLTCIPNVFPHRFHCVSPSNTPAACLQIGHNKDSLESKPGAKNALRVPELERLDFLAEER